MIYIELSSTALAQIGLIFGAIGVVLLFFYGSPPMIEAKDAIAIDQELILSQKSLNKRIKFFFWIGCCFTFDWVQLSVLVLYLG